jgi:hypothetical protein
MQETYTRTFRNFSLQFSDGMLLVNFHNTRWFKFDRDDLCVNKSQFVPVIFEPPCIFLSHTAVNILSDCWHKLLGFRHHIPQDSWNCTKPKHCNFVYCLFFYSRCYVYVHVHSVWRHKFLNIYLKFPPSKDTWAQKTGFSWTHIETSPSSPSPVSKLKKTNLVKADQPLLFTVLIGTTIVSSSFQQQRFPSRPTYLLQLIIIIIIIILLLLLNSIKFALEEAMKAQKRSIALLFL